MDNSVKGTVLIKMVKTLRKHRERALVIVPPELHKYLDQKILASSWYPIEDYVALFRAVGELIPDPGMDVFEYLGRISAQMDFEGIYNPMVRGKDALGCLTAIVNMQKLTNSTVTFVLQADAEAATIERVHFGEAFVEETCKSQTGYIWQALTYGGAKAAEAKHVLCRHRGDDRCLWKAHWKDAEDDGRAPLRGPSERPAAESSENRAEARALH